MQFLSAAHVELQKGFHVFRDWERFGASPFSELLETQSLKQEEKKPESIFQWF